MPGAAFGVLKNSAPREIFREIRGMMVCES
jgi:hypothetical protein